MLHTVRIYIYTHLRLQYYVVIIFMNQCYWQTLKVRIIYIYSSRKYRQIIYCSIFNSTFVWDIIMFYLLICFLTSENLVSPAIVKILIRHMFGLLQKLTEMHW